MRVAMVHARALLRVALRLVRDRVLAEDLVQEALLRAWKSFDQFQAGTNCKAWLFKIMFNVFHRDYQRAVAAPRVVSLDSQPEEIGAVLVHDDASRFSDFEIISALDALPEEQRAVLVLAVAEGFTCKEISEMLAIPMGTVMSRLSRGRASLRSKLSSGAPRMGVLDGNWADRNSGKGVV